MSAPAGTSRYFAFISYSHQDQRWADWLHKALETYRVPSRLVGQTTAAGVIPSRIAPIFRDRDELASSSDLGRTVNAAIAQSRNLIVICSPAAAQSRWVNEEVLAFKRRGGADRIFCCIVDGEPNATEMPGRAAEECFAPALRFTLDANGQPTTERTEPIAADAREGKDGRANAKLKLIAGMLDVGFDALKQRELQRRNRRMAIITAAALVIMAITTTLAITAVIARADAERRQKQAEDLVDFMLGDLNDKLQQVQRLDILEAVDDKAMAYFGSLPTTDVTDEALQQRAKALEKIGSVRYDQGHLPAAMESFQAAIGLSRALAEAAPNDISRQVAYSRLWAFAGKTAWSQGDLAAAQRSFEAAQAVLQGAEARSADKAELLYQLTSIDNNIGHVLEASGRLDEAEIPYRRMLDRCKRLLTGKDVKTAWTSQLGAAHNNLGKLALMRGDLAVAIAEYSADDAIESELSARDPKDNDQLAYTFVVRAILGRTLALTGDIAGGVGKFQEAIDIGGKLAAVDPTVTYVQENLALYRVQLSRLLRLSGQMQKATALTAQGLDTLAALAKQDPTNSNWQREFAEAQLEHSAQLVVAGRVSDARENIPRTLEVLSALLAKQPDNRSLLLVTVSGKLLLASVAEDPRVAQSQRDEALAVSQSVKSGAGDPRLLALQTEALIGNGRKSDAELVIRKLWECGYRDLALLALLQGQQIEYPLNTAFRERMQAITSKKDS